MSYHSVLLFPTNRLFFQAEKVNIDAKCASLDEHLPEAVHCYNQAVKGYAKEGMQINQIVFLRFIPFSSDVEYTPHEVFYRHGVLFARILEFQFNK